MLRKALSKSGLSRLKKQCNRIPVRCYIQLDPTDKVSYKNKLAIINSIFSKNIFFKSTIKDRYNFYMQREEFVKQFILSKYSNKKLIELSTGLYCNIDIEYFELWMG